MTDRPIDAPLAGSTTDTASNGFGRFATDQKAQLSSAFDDARGRSLDTYGKAMDKLDGLVGRAPERFQPQARSAIAAARQRPLLTTLAVAGLGILLAGAARGRR